MHLVGVFILIVAVAVFLGIGDSRELVGGCLGVIFVVFLIILAVTSCSNKQETPTAQAPQDIPLNNTFIANAAESTSSNDKSLEEANGLFDASNYHEAALIYQKLGHSADGLVESRIAWMYYTGNGMPQNEEKSYALYAKAARLGDADAQAMLGQFYANGEYYPKNLAQGYVWSLVSKAQGNRQASDNKDSIEKQLSGYEIQMAKEIATNCAKSHYRKCKYTPPEPKAEPPVVAPSPPPIPSSVVPAPATPRGRGNVFTDDDYPTASRRAEEEGVTRVSYVVGVDGLVAQCEVVQTSGFQRLDDATCAIIRRRFRFNPATLNGQPVPERRSMPTRWRLTN
jgi:protein TonB